ncbi:MAG: hypothetical protein K6G00_07200 [Treponema sp.]|nr:hypothetical protein [Treponema sp.]
MSRDRRSKKRNGNNWKNNYSNENSRNGGKRNDVKNHGVRKTVSAYAVSPDQIRADEEAITAFKSSNRPICEHCGLPIADLATAVEDKKSGNPIHFDCAVKILAEEENLAEGDRITYIGQGRFGVLYFANPHDMKHFTIKKIIEWEDKDKKPEWRDQMADLYSHVK